MNTDLSDITNLSSLLRQNGDKVLNGLSKLSLNSKFLEKINEHFVLLLDDEEYFENNSSFKVLRNYNTKQTLVQDLQFLHDFMQKTIGLKITNNIRHNGKIDISKFKCLKYLEISKVNIKEVHGLKQVRSHIQSIICKKCINMLEELLAECGGDNTSGFVWSELKEAVLPYNYIKIIDTSIAFAPWLQVLDLSHNQISDAKAIECLPNLKYINLGYNCLDHVPTLNKSVRKKVQVLIIKNNFIEDLTGLIGLDYLTELDLSFNWLSRHDTLYPFLSMSALQWLSLQGNPLSYHPDHRLSTVRYLHISSAFSTFVLDSKSLTKSERPYVGLNLNATQRQHSPVRHTPFTYEPQTSTAAPETKRSQKSNKKGKSKVAVIVNLDDGTIEDPPTDLSLNSLIEASTEHLETKKQIESLRNRFGSNWLHSEAASEIQDILGLPASSSTPYDEVYRACGSLKVTTTTAVIEKPPVDVDKVETKEQSDMFLSCVDDSSMFHSVLSQPVAGGDAENGDHLVKDTSPDIELIQDSEEEMEEDKDEMLFLVTKETKVNGDVRRQEMFLTITQDEMREKEMNHGRTVTKWSMCSLQSCVQLTHNKLHVTFDTIRRDKKERVYEIDAEFTTLYKYLTDLLDSRSLSEMNQIVLKCMKCSLQFSHEVQLSRQGTKPKCPTCFSKVIIEVDETPLPTQENNKTKQDKVTQNGVKPGETNRNTHNRSSSIGVMQTFTTYDNISSQSSIVVPDDNTTGGQVVYNRSAASLDELNELPGFQNSNVKRSDSDIEILSNPSQSSIEVIDGPGRMYGGSTPRRKRSSEERQAIAPVQLYVPETLARTNTGLTESSSSGSVTDSICTAYENNSMATSNISKSSASASDHTEKREDVEPVHAGNKLNTMIEGVIDTVTSKLSHDKSTGFKSLTDTIEYSYTDFTSIDHRVKLFIYLQVLEEESEEIVFLLRGSVLLDTYTSADEGCVVCSTKKVYILKIIGPEAGDDAVKFLHKSDLPSFQLQNLKVIHVLPWKQGVGLRFQDNNNKRVNFLTFLKDPVRTDSFISFISNEELLCKKIEESIESPRQQLSVQQLLLSIAENTTLNFLTMFTSCLINDEINVKQLNNSIIIVTNSDLILLNDNMLWFCDGNNDKLQHFTCQKMSNLMQAETQGTTLALHFLNELQGKVEIWVMNMETTNNVDKLLNCIKTPWEDLFSVPLQITAVDVDS